MCQYEANIINVFKIMLSKIPTAGSRNQSGKELRTDRPTAEKARREVVLDLGGLMRKFYQ